MLHITNGDSVQLREAVSGDVVVWLDVLHEGPVPAGLPFGELSSTRSRWLARAGFSDAPARFAKRDSVLTAAADHDEVVLWFEADLFDQLQLIQILDWFSSHPARMLSMISSEMYLGPMSPEELAALFPTRREVSPAQFELAGEAWSAFRSPDPTAIEALLGRRTQALPFVADALARHLEEFPSVRSGISRTERQILEGAESGIHDRVMLFVNSQSKEERIFLGDTFFFRYVSELCGGPVPLLEQNGDAIDMTPKGSDVLAGRADRVRLNGMDRWLGGVHLDGRAAWRWDESARRIRRSE